MVKVLFSVDLASEKLPPFWSLLQLIRAVNSPYLVGPPLSTKFTSSIHAAVTQKTYTVLM